MCHELRQPRFKFAAVYNIIRYGGVETIKPYVEVDTGLLGSILLKGIQFQVLSGDISVNEGALTENYVACALSAKGISLHYYDKNSKQELDFIIEEQNKITVIEVKSGEKYKKHASLDAAVKDYTDKIHRSIVLSRYNVSRKDDVLYLPLYMTIFI